MSALFIQITPETTQHTIASNLTKMQYRLWLFLYHLDPFGDRPVLIPTPVELAAQLNMSVRSIYRALRKLKELGLFTIASNYTRSITNGVKNQPLGTKKLRSRSFKRSAKNVTVVPEMSSTLPKLSQPCQNWQNQPPQPNQDKGLNQSQTNTDNIQTLSELAIDLKIREASTTDNLSIQPTSELTSLPYFDGSHIEENENINSMANSQELVDFWFEDDVCNSSSIAAKDPGRESIALSIEQSNENVCSNIEAELVDNDRPLSTNKTATNSIAPVDWLPSGPWSIEGKLDPNFRDWLAKEWIKEYGGTIAQKRANVLAYFHSKPAMLPVRWEQYHSEYVDRYTNAQTRMANGMSIDPTEQQQLINHTTAVSNPLPPAMSPVAAKSEVRSQESDLLESEVRSQESGVNSKESVIDFSALDRHEEIPENPDAYKLLQPSNINPKAGLELLKSAFTMKKPLAKPKTELKENPIAKLNSWLKDPILYPEAIARAKNNGYSIEYNENGRAIAIYELDF